MTGLLPIALRSQPKTHVPATTCVHGSFSGLPQNGIPMLPFAGAACFPCFGKRGRERIFNLQIPLNPPLPKGEGEGMSVGAVMDFRNAHAPCFGIKRAREGFRQGRVFNSQIPLNPPFAKGEDEDVRAGAVIDFRSMYAPSFGIKRAREGFRQGRIFNLQIPLNPPFAKGEGKGMSAGAVMDFRNAHAPCFGIKRAREGFRQGRIFNSKIPLNPHFAKGEGKGMSVGIVMDFRNAHAPSFGKGGWGWIFNFKNLLHSSFFQRVGKWRQSRNYPIE